MEGIGLLTLKLRNKTKDCFPSVFYTIYHILITPQGINFKVNKGVYQRLKSGIIQAFHLSDNSVSKSKL